MYSHEPANYSCPFCQLVHGGEDTYNSQKDIVFEDEETLAFVSPKWWVNNPGHVLVIPKLHIENIYSIPDELLGKVYVTAKKIAIAMKKKYNCDGTSMRQHNEPSGNQGVWHFHVHVFPRYANNDLYLNHKKKAFVENKEKDKYIKLLKDYFSK